MAVQIVVFGALMRVSKFINWVGITCAMVVVLSKGGCEVTAVVTDITALETDVIVNAANKALLGGGGVDGAIHKAAGPDLREECLRLRRGLPNGIGIGEVAVTGAYNLPAKWVIHTVGPMQGFDDVSLLAKCYENALMKAEELGAKSIAFPAISTGKHRVSIEFSAKVVAKVLRSFEPSNLKKIVLVLQNQDQINMYVNYIGNGNC